MAIKKLNPENMAAPLAGGAVERNAVNNSNKGDATMEDELENEGDELTPAEEDETDEGEEDETDEGEEDEFDEQDEDNEDEITTDEK